MKQERNCTTIAIEGIVIGQGGAPANNIVLRLRWLEFVDWRVSGQGKPPGEWGFAPYGNYWDNPHAFTNPTTFYVDIVDKVGGSTPRSDTRQVDFVHCDVAGKFTNIKFVYQY